MSQITLEPEDASMIVGAIDTLGCALAEHGHIFTEGEVALYTEAVKLLGHDAGKLFKQVDDDEDWKSGSLP